MQVSYQWLSEFINLENITPEELADKMSRTGIEVEEVKHLDADLKKIVVGEVIDCIDHPNSDHLHICQVNIGEEVTQIVCGAPNVATGQKVIVALPGARIVDNVKIKKGKIRGEVSNGMLCSLEELGLETAVIPKEESDGIYILPEESIPGENALPLVKMDDTILDLAITPNRADALSMRGVTYEVAAIYNKEMDFPKFALTTEAELKNLLKVKNEVNEQVPTYAVRYITDVKVKPSPKWLQFHLMHAGIRPINNIVDITNYILLMFGQPLHAYDANKLQGSLTVRKANEGEKLLALNDESYNLDQNDLIIADEKGPVALAGIIGGKATSVTTETTNICLEAALFEQTMIRKSSQKYHLRTDASQRFEKGIDHNAVIEALDAAAALLVEYADGKVAKDMVIADLEEVIEPTITIELQRINQVLGLDLTYLEVANILKALRFEYRDIDKVIFVITVPSRRFDISIEADIIEEIGRLYGYDRLPNTLPKMAINPGARTPMNRLIYQTQQTLQKLGLQETINYALTTEDKAQAFVLSEGESIKLKWPMSEERAVLRRNLISGLLDTFKYNLARKNNNLAFYEIGKVFTKDENYSETTHVAFALTGKFGTENWHTKPQNVDFYTLKGLVEAYLEQFAFQEEIRYQATEKHLNMHPYQTADIYLGDNYLGYLGQIHPEVAKKFDLTATYVAELDLELLNLASFKKLTVKEVSKYPAVTRDIALLVDENLTNSIVETAIYQKGSKALIDVKLFDVYSGSKIASGQKSLAYQLTFQKNDATLTDQEIEEIMAKITKYLQTEFQAEIR